MEKALTWTELCQSLVLAWHPCCGVTGCFVIMISAWSPYAVFLVGAGENYWCLSVLMRKEWMNETVPVSHDPNFFCIIRSYWPPSTFESHHTLTFLSLSLHAFHPFHIPFSVFFHPLFLLSLVISLSLSACCMLWSPLLTCSFPPRINWLRPLLFLVLENTWKKMATTPSPGPPPYHLQELVLACQMFYSTNKTNLLPEGLPPFFSLRRTGSHDKTLGLTRTRRETLDYDLFLLALYNSCYSFSFMCSGR